MVRREENTVYTTHQEVSKISKKTTTDRHCFLQFPVSWGTSPPRIEGRQHRQNQNAVNIMSATKNCGPQDYGYDIKRTLTINTIYH
eukprot:1780802-Amphidinium_carterae.1